jgi:SAM-dependent methyltransferase
VPSFDPETYRADSREGWDRAAKGWSERRAAMQRDAEPVSRWLVDAAELKPGGVVLEVAAGLGDTGLLAAARVAPGGKVVITDGSEEMVAAARDHAGAAGADNVEVRQMEAEWLDQPTASVDAVLSRWGYMLLADPEAALREARRVLRPGGRIALAAWDPMDVNPWIGTILRAVAELRIAPPPQPGVPGMFALAAPGHVEQLLESAGFTEIRRDSVDFAWHAESLDAWWDHTRTVSVSLGELLGRLAPAEHYALRDAVDGGYAPWVAADGSLSLPARALVATAEA